MVIVHKAMVVIKWCDDRIGFGDLFGGCGDCGMIEMVIVIFVT